MQPPAKAKHGEANDLRFALRGCYEYVCFDASRWVATQCIESTRSKLFALGRGRVRRLTTAQAEMCDETHETHET